MQRICFESSTLDRSHRRQLFAATLVACALCLLVSVPTSAQFGGGGGGFGGGPGMGGGGGGPQPEPEKKRTRNPLFGPLEKIPVVSINIVGNETVAPERILTMISTRQNKLYDPAVLKADVRKLVTSGMFQDVRTFKKDVPGGKAITFQVVERPTIGYVRYVGNEKIKDKDLNKSVGIRHGDPLNRFAVEEASRRLKQVYDDKGFGDSHVEVLEGTGVGDKGVVFRIHEGSITRIFKVAFSGNTIATDGRLKTQIDSKPGILWVLGGKANYDQIDQDVQRLTAYYRSLGFFRARIGRQIEYNDDRSWMTIKFIIDEGARYQVRNIRMVGNTTFPARRLMQQTELRSGEYFNLSRMQRDLALIRDEYGGQGFIFADVQAEPRFKEAPGEIDIVYKVNEGKQYRVGRILVNIDGEYAHTKRSVVLNRLSIRPGDIVDIRKLRASERRLQGSSLFNVNPATGDLPRIVVKPPVVDDETQIADNGDTIRGQSPHATPHVSYRPIIRPVVNDGGQHPAIDLFLDYPTTPHQPIRPNKNITPDTKRVATPHRALNR